MEGRERHTGMPHTTVHPHRERVGPGATGDGALGGQWGVCAIDSSSDNVRSNLADAAAEGGLVRMPRPLGLRLEHGLPDESIPLCTLMLEYLPCTHATTEWAKFWVLSPETCLIWHSFVSQSRF